MLEQFAEIEITVTMKVSMPVPSPALTADGRRKHDAAIFNSIVMPTLRANARTKFVKAVTKLRKEAM